MSSNHTCYTVTAGTLVPLTGAQPPWKLFWWRRALSSAPASPPSDKVRTACGDCPPRIRLRPGRIKDLTAQHTKKKKNIFEYFSSRSPPLKNKKKQSGSSPPLYLMFYNLVSAYKIVVSRPQIPKISNNLIVTYPSLCIQVYS